LDVVFKRQLSIVTYSLSFVKHVATPNRICVIIFKTIRKKPVQVQIVNGSPTPCTAFLIIQEIKTIKLTKIS